MQSRLWLLTIPFLGIALCIVRQPSAAEPGAPFVAPRPLPLTANFLGAGSCSASACHNANFAHGSTGSEYTKWMTRDPHAKAYEVLFDERSKRMQKNLSRQTPAHQEQRCLSCHVAPAYLEKSPPPAAPYFKTDGVSCESCHGPAKDWINEHHLDAWRWKSIAEKKRLGMYDTQSLVGRVQVCVTCHVGAAGMEVDHDLIAAGHPRLHFEFAAFHAHLPRHWPDGKDRARVQGDFDTQAWAVGQLATARAALELLAERTGNPASAWPEFAEFDCAACHHDLQSPSPRQKIGFGQRKAGVFPWGHYVALTPLALDYHGSPHATELRTRLAALQKRMDAGSPARDIIAADARKTAALLQGVLDRLDVNAVKTLPAQEHLRAQLASKATASSDERTQLHLALAALHRGRLDLPTNFTLQSFDPQAIRARLSLLQKR